MNNLFKILFASLLLFATYSCSEKDYGDASQNQVPSIDTYKNQISATVDQNTNLVTLKIDDNSVMPVWIFEDGTTSNTNEYKMTVRLAGTYTIEAKVGNKHGISDGSVKLTYTINNTLVDKDLIKFLCGGTSSSKKEWVWNSKADGHFGCGPSYTEPTGWWSCSSNGKAGMGMYDDIFTFEYSGSGISGAYSYNPGVGNTIYVNSGCNFDPFKVYNTNDGNDYQATVSSQSSSWSFTYEGNDLYLTFPTKAMVGYIPNIETYTNPKFKIISLTEDKISMACFNGSIAWKFEFLSKQLFDSGVDSPLNGSEYAKAIPGSWVWDETTDGHFGCGPDSSSPVSWWSCGAEGKAGWGLYDDMLTFGADGSYTFNPGSGGTIYANKDCSFAPLGAFNPNDGNDFQATVGSQTATYSITNDGTNYYLQFPAKTFVSYVPSEEVYNNPKYLIAKMTKSSIEFVSLGTGISWRYRFVKK